jgi:hypothetical protein
VGGRLGGERVHQLGDQLDRLPRRIAAVQPQVERDLIVARAPRVQRRTVRRDLGESPLDRGVDVLVGRGELERAVVQLAADSAQAALDSRQLRAGKNAGGLQAAGVGNAPGDVVRVQLEVDCQRGGEPFELGQQAALKASAPEFLAYLVSLLASPRSRPKSRE